MKKNLILFLFISALSFSQEITPFKGAVESKSITKDGTTFCVIAKDSDGNVVESINSDGFYSIRYRDEYVGGVWLVPQGVNAPDVVTVTIGGISTLKYAFDGGNTEERLANTFEIAHDVPIDLINAGTLKIEWHVHYRPATTGTGDVQWWFDWSYTPPPVNGTVYAPIAMSALNCIGTIQANTTYYQYLSAAELSVPLGGFQIGGVITFNLRRTPNGGSDTYAGDALLIKTALHVPTDGNGSRQRYIK
jgi:hypothetical protein